MAATAVRRPHHQGFRLFDEPVLFRRTRRNLAQLAGLLWFVAEVVRLVRSRRD